MENNNKNSVAGSAADAVFLADAISLAQQARDAGDHPFGAVLVCDGQVVGRARNTVHSGHSDLNHAELKLLEVASQELGREQLSRCTLYASTEPCAMCCGALYWAGVRRVVYAFGASELAALAGGSFLFPSRQLLAHANEPVEIIGPHDMPGARAVHEGFWARSQD
jgi:tRNA(Arg) A34 adenosine deaminase TadA